MANSLLHYSTPPSEITQLPGNRVIESRSDGVRSKFVRQSDMFM